ncbi:MAG: DUF2845 domain-containing protein [Halofilum sp. (in: g-proteobacteria)]|nr:DUF2845 domain-containing protein [Halofilum sp. (in: g-proteobacteria)]
MRTIGACMLLLALSLFAVPAQALRCGTELVREGDAQFEVRRACGEPDWVAAYHDGHASDREIWHYNFGPNELIRVLRFRDGRLQRIRTAGRGFRAQAAPGGCRPGELLAGMSALEVLHRCGEPVQRELRGVVDRVHPRGLGHRPRRFRRVLVEDWYYDFGSGYLARRLELVDGIVARIETLR